MIFAKPEKFLKELDNSVLERIAEESLNRALFWGFVAVGTLLLGQSSEGKIETILTLATVLPTIIGAVEARNYVVCKELLETRGGR